MANYSFYLQNITEFPFREIPQVHIPDNLDDLKEIVKHANANKSPLYPVSTGHNWGLGSKLPVTRADIVDLKNLNDIIEVNRELCYARIQPGVTQRQLSEYLKIHAPELMLNVTGGDSGSSVLANILERGSGKNGHRAEDIRELKILLANGEEFSTGFGNVNHGLSYFKYGIGPDLTHLFTQSNYGIVTEGVVNLMVRQPFTLYLIKVKKADLGDFLDSFARLVRTEIIGHSLELDSQNDPKIYELFQDTHEPDDTWIGWFVVYGVSELRKIKEKLLLESISRFTVDLRSYLSEGDNSAAPAPVQVRIDRYRGVPNDHSLTSSAKAFGVDLPDGDIDIDLYKEMPGFRCVLPVLPFSSSAARVLDTIYEFSGRFSFVPAISIIGLNNYSLEAFVRVYFRRTSTEEVRHASKWATELLAELRRHHILPYRLDVENMQSFLSDLQDPALVWKNRIKRLFDPENIIAPNRYCQ